MFSMQHVAYYTEVEFRYKSSTMSTNAFQSNNNLEMLWVRISSSTESFSNIIYHAVVWAEQLLSGRIHLHSVLSHNSHYVSTKVLN